MFRRTSFYLEVASHPSEDLPQQGCKKKPVLQLSGEVEFDECYIVAGQKGQPAKVIARQRESRRRRLKGKRGRGTALDEKNPVFGIAARSGQIILRVLENVKQKTIRPIINQGVEKDTQVYTDEYNIYNRLKDWGYRHQLVEHGKGEYARDEDGDGFCEVHCNTIEGIWSLLRSWLRPHRGVSQEKLPFYVGFFEWMYNLKKRGQKALNETLKCLLQPDQRTYEECILNFSLKTE